MVTLQVSVHYPAPPVKNWRILLVKSFDMPLLTATSTFRLGRRRWSSPRQCYLHYYTRLMALFPELLRWASTRKVKPIWILLKQETVSGSGISWAICKSAPCSRQITTPAPPLLSFYRPDAIPAAQPTASKHWRCYLVICNITISEVIGTAGIVCDLWICWASICLSAPAWATAAKFAAVARPAGDINPLLHSAQ